LCNLEELHRSETTKRFGGTLAVGCCGEEGGFLASAYTSGQLIRIIDLHTEEEIAVLRGHRHWVNCMAWKPGSLILASTSPGAEVLLWDLNASQDPILLEKRHGVVTSLAWDPTGVHLGAVLENGSICIWEVHPRRKLAFQAELPPAVALAWSASGSRIALISRSNEIVLWNLFDSSVSRLPVNALEVAWHPKVDLLAVVALQGAIEIWDIRGEAPELRLSLFETPPIRGLVITADGYVDGPPEALKTVRYADGLALYDLEDLPERHDPERVRQAMAILSP